MTKKPFTVMLTLAIGMTLLIAACGKDLMSNKNKTSSPPATAPVPVSFKILASDGGNAYAKSITKPEDDPYIKEMSRLFSESIKQPTTIGFEFVPQADFSQQLTVRFASKDLPAVIATTGIHDKGHPKAVESGVFMELNDLIDNYGPNLKKNIPSYIWDSPKVSNNGKIYGIPTLLNPVSPAAIYVRQDYLDKLGMTQLPETPDEYLAFFEKVKTTDLNGNGKQDEIGYAMRGGFGFSNTFFAPYGVFPGEWQLVDGKFIPDIINPKMIAAINFYKILYDNGYVDKDFSTARDVEWTNSIKSGRAAVWSHDLRNMGTSWSASSFLDANFKLGVLPGFKQPDGTYRIQPKASGISKVGVILTGTNNPERIIQFYDWLNSDDPLKKKFTEFGVSGRNYTEEAGKVNWDDKGTLNKDGEAGFYQAMINQAADTRMDLPVVEAGNVIDPKVLAAARAYIENNLWNDPAVNMPPLEATKMKPELDYTGASSLFIEMLLKTITGKVPVDSGFNNYVADWKKRGGDQAIDEATQWYNDQKK